MDYKISHETVESAWDDVAPLIKAHFIETSFHSEFPLNPDKTMYVAACKAGFYKVFTVRHGKNLVGYVGYFLQRHPHVNAIQANTDLIYIRSDYRRQGLAKKLLTFADEFLKNLGVNYVYFTISEKMDFSKLLIDSGYNPVDRSYARRL